MIDNSIMQELQRTLTELQKDVHAIHLRFEHVEEKVIERVDKLEQLIERNAFQIQNTREEFHELDKRLAKVEPMIEQVGKTRHHSKNLEQRIVIVEENHKTTDKVLEKMSEQIEAIHTAQVKDDINWASQGAMVKVLGSKPALVVYTLALSAFIAKFGVGV